MYYIYPIKLLEMAKVTDFEKLFYSLYPSLCRKAHKYIENKEVCEDIVQECFIKYWENCEKEKAIKNPTSYLNTAIKNNCIGYLKQQKHKDNIDDPKLQGLLGTIITDEDENKDQTNQIDEQEIIRQALSLLPEKCKQIFELSKIQHKSYKGIAEHLNISTKTVENQMGKALKIMKQFVKNNPDYFL